MSVQCVKPMIDLHYCCLNDARKLGNWEKCRFLKRQCTDRCCFEVNVVSGQLQFFKGAGPKVLRVLVCQGDSFLGEHDTKY